MPAVSFTRLEEEALALYAPPRRRKSTWFKVRCVLREFRELPGIRRSSDITPMAILRWIEAHDDRSPMTNRSYLKTFQAVCTYAKKMGYLRVSPWEIRTDWITFDLDEEDEPEARHLSIDELRALLDQLDAEALAGGWLEWRLQALGYTYVHTALRAREALGLKLVDIELKRGVIRLRSRRRRKLKTRTSERIVGIPDHLRVVYERWIPQCGSEWLFPGVRRKTPWMGGTSGKRPLDAIKAVAGRAGIEHVTIHALRRSLATHAARLGISRDERKDLLGHGSLRTGDDWYTEEDASNARDVAKRIRFRSKRPKLWTPGPVVSRN